MRRACHMQHQQQQKQRKLVSRSTVVKMQQEIFKFVKRAAFPMHATIPESRFQFPLPLPLPHTRAACSSSTYHACVNLRGAQLIFCKCLERRVFFGQAQAAGRDRNSLLRGYVLLIALKCSVQRAACSEQRVQPGGIACRLANY